MTSSQPAFLHYYPISGRQLRLTLEAASAPLMGTTETTSSGDNEPTSLQEQAIDNSSSNYRSAYIPGQMREPRARFCQMVEVYNGGTFIKKMPIKLLIRFSKAAAATFPPPEPVAGPSGARTAHTRPPTIYDAATGYPIPKRLVLDVNAPENPTHYAVGAALKWMTDNRAIPRTQQLMDFGPERLPEVDLVSLLDFYQAVLAFEMRPFPSRIKHEIQRRVSETPPTLDVVRSFVAYIPTQDTTMVRLLTSFCDYLRDGRYSDGEAGQILSAIAARADLWRKWREIEHKREQKFERMAQRGKEGKKGSRAKKEGNTSRGVRGQPDVIPEALAEVESAENTVVPGQVGEEVVLAEVGETDTPPVSGRRRRDRRKVQQAFKARGESSGV